MLLSACTNSASKIQGISRIFAVNNVFFYCKAIFKLMNPLLTGFLPLYWHPLRLLIGKGSAPLVAKPLPPYWRRHRLFID